MSPHCLFLFHTIPSGTVYVLQAKGCFSAILPEDKPFQPFGDFTSWGDLAQINYSALADVIIPEPAKLSQDTVLLPNGTELNINDIYNDTLPESERLRLIADYSALDVIVLASKTRGRDKEGKRWISKLRKTAKDSLWLNREDLQGKAQEGLRGVLRIATPSSCLEEDPDKLWQASRSDAGGSPSFESARMALRGWHALNWAHFKTNVEEDERKSRAVNSVVGTLFLP